MKSLIFMLRVLVGLLLLIFLVVMATKAGQIFFINTPQNQEQSMSEIAHSDAAKVVYEGFLKERDPLAFTPEGVIQSYEIDDSSLEYNPMGGLMVTLVINGDKELNVSFNLLKNDNNSYSSAYFTVSRKLGDTIDKNK